MSEKKPKRLHNYPLADGQGAVFDAVRRADTDSDTDVGAAEKTKKEIAREDSKESADNTQARYVNIARIVRLYQKNLLDAKHDELLAKIENAIFLERTRYQLLWSIENVKKNALMHAWKLYGDKADISGILDSAERAKEKLTPVMDTFSAGLSACVDSFLRLKDEAPVRFPNGSIRMMDKEVADALELYRNKNDSVLIELDDYDKDAEDQMFVKFKFRPEELERMAYLQGMIQTDDEALTKFARKAPDGMPQTEYNYALREGRFSKDRAVKSSDTLVAESGGKRLSVNHAPEFG